MSRHLFTSKSVSMDHPDQMADQISDSILDAILEQDPRSRVACETLIATGRTWKLCGSYFGVGVQLSRPKPPNQRPSTSR